MDFSIWSVLLIVTKMTLYISSFLAVGSVVFLASFRTVQNDIFAATKRLIYISVPLAIISSIGFLLVQTGYIMEDGVAGMFDIEMLEMFLQENIGSSLYMRVVGVALLLLAVVFMPQQYWLHGIFAILVAASFAMIGHATGDNQIYTTILLVIHLLAVSFWLGALWPLYLSANQPEGADMLERFGKIASIVVPLLIVVGVLFAIYIVGSVSALFDSSYGISLLVKVGIVGLLLGLASLNKIYFVPQIAAQNRQAVKWLRLTIMVEAAAFLAIFALTAALTTVMTLPE
ncbi:MAG: CopD family protein [OCS116 cluster bacterium]|nr:CopD family protein [OCS116 cluster bacterium]